MRAWQEGDIEKEKGNERREKEEKKAQAGLWLG